MAGNRWPGLGRNTGPASRGEIDQEIELYLDLRTLELVEEEGLERSVARVRALEAFGDPSQIAESCERIATQHDRQNRLGDVMWGGVQDLKLGLRVLSRSPGFAIMAVLTLSLGIGATTAIVSLADAVLLQKPAVEEPDELVAVYTTCRRGDPRCSSSYLDYQDYRDRATRLVDLAGSTYSRLNLSTDAGGRVTWGKLVTGNYFEVLGLVPQVGRLISPEDDRLESPSSVAVISDGLWERAFGRDPKVAGREIVVNGLAYQVLGVAPADYRGLALDDAVDVWLPLTSIALTDPSFGDRLSERGARWIATLIGRRIPGAEVEQIQAEMVAISDGLRQEDPDARGPRTITVDPVGSYLLPVGGRSAVVTYVRLLVGVVFLALLLTCANLANLFLARAAGRTKEIGLRLALGSGRRRIFRQFLTESLLLASLGGVGGLFVGLVVLGGVGQFELPGGIPVSSLNVGLNARMFTIAALITALTGLLFGTLPAFHAGRQNLRAALSGVRAGRDPRTGPRRALIALQVALCTVLLVGSGLFLRSLQEALSTSPGFTPAQVVQGRLNLELAGYTPERADAFAAELTPRLEDYPGVISASWGQRIPLQLGGGRGFFAGIEGYEPGSDGETRFELNVVSPGHLATLGRTMIAGREFTFEDREGAPQVAIISETMANRYWPGGRAVGGRLSLGSGMEFDESSSVFDVVGVVADVKWRSLDEEGNNYVTIPFAQSSGDFASRGVSITIRSSGPKGPLIEHLRNEVRALDPDLPIEGLGTIEDNIARVVMPQRMGAILLSAFAILSLVMATVGIAGVVGYSVSRRTREVGIRMALGAERSEVVRLVARQMFAPIAVGLALGIGASLSLSRVAQSFLVGVSAHDPVTYLVIIGILGGVGVVSAWIPALKAAGVDPVTALRQE